MTVANIKKPFKRARWRQTNPGQWTSREGYTLTALNETTWRLCDPTGKFLVDQLELFPSEAPLTDWADQYIRAQPKTS
jgi:hypothetical protein